MTGQRVEQRKCRFQGPGHSVRMFVFVPWRQHNQSLTGCYVPLAGGSARLCRETGATTMTDRTTNLRLPFILPAQAQKHVTHNEALLRLDGIVHLAVKDELATPPAAPSEGDCYLVAGAATDVWSGRAGLLAIWQDGAWDFAEPMEGWRAWFIPARSIRVFSDGLWQDALPPAARFDELGIGATADPFNRLVISSPASLFTHAGEGHQIKVNKQSTAQTASLLFQSGWTGHAEMGLAGNNDFSIKVSDGSDWKTGLAITATGQVQMPNQPLDRKSVV